MQSYGLEPVDANQIVLTRRVSVLFIPVIPPGRYKVRYIGPTCYSGIWDQVLIRNFDYQIVERISISMFSVARTLLWTFIALFATIVPLVVLVMRCANRAASTIELIALLIAIFGRAVFRP